jgi:AraC-like DNA-binding protein
MSKLDACLETYIEDGSAYKQGLPSVVFLAEQVGLSPSYLNDLVKSCSGHSVSNYIDLVILEQAKLRLSRSAKPVSSIAFELGFQHSQSFNRFFRKHAGQSPGQFRKTVH